MKTKSRLIILFLFISLTANLQAGDKIKIKLHQPPPNKMGVGDLWNLTLENTTQNDLKIYLTGTVTEDKDGVILEGKSKVFTIKPGNANFKYNDFSGAEVKYNNGKYKEIILRTGNAPEGSYTICVTAYEESGEVAGMENCIMQTVQQLGSITLISPENGAELDSAMPLIFSWTPLPNAKDYKLRIVEIKGDESPETALQNNPEVFSVTSNTAAYTTRGGEHLPWPLKKKKYAWQVSSGDVVSEPYVIRIPWTNPEISLIFPSNGMEIDPDSLSGLTFSWKECPKCPPMYTLRIVELKGDQSPDEAFRTNQPIFEKEYRSTSTQGDPIHGVDVKLGMKLAWMVTSGDVSSEAYTVRVKLKRPPLNQLISQFKLELQKEGKTVNETKTDTSGNFSFSNVENGEYRLKITRDGSPMPDRLLLSFGPGGIIICCCPGPPCDDPVVLIMGDEKTTKIKALYFVGCEISAKIVPFPPVGPHIPHR